MPHQLRRIIAINIRNATTDQPSGVIAELNPRGSTFAIGDNGAGKTTFLRLLPLFYGATPQQILRGSGKSSLIAYSLPDASSAVAYEYERENETDLRCVIMHCEAGEDRPMFRIIENGGFKESYVYDEEGFFVTREDFPARAERMGAQLSQKLHLNLYRSVILKERLHTKEGQRVRDLAERHSLGSRPLTHLDQIAAAMVNEKISFADLRNIAIDRISDTSSSDKPSTITRELRKRPKDVVKWLDDLNHLNSVMGKAPLAQAVAKTIERVQNHHLQLCSLHQAVKAALRQVEGEQAQLIEEDRIARQQGAVEAARLDALLIARRAERSAAEVQRDDAQQALDAATSRLQHFQSINVGAMGQLQDREEEIKKRKASAAAELERLTVGAGAAQESAALRRRTIDLELAVALQKLGERELNERNEIDQRMNANRTKEAEALARHVAPARLAEIAKLRDTGFARLGALGALIANPTASAAARQKVIDADGLLNQAREAYEAARRHTQTSEQAAEAQRRDAAEKIQLVANARTAQAGAAQMLESLQQQLTPAPGTLLEYLRKAEPGSWEDTARVLDPSLLARTDLHPAESALEANGRDSLVVGSLLLDVRDVPLPGWVDMAALRAQIATAQKRLAGANDELIAAQQVAQRASRAHTNAMKIHQEMQGRESLALQALEKAKTNHDRMVAATEQEALLCRQNAEIEKNKLGNEISALDAEAGQIDAGFKASLKAIAADFAAQREALGNTESIGRRFTAERADLSQRHEGAIAQMQQDQAKELQGLGIDPIRITALEDSIRELGGTLLSIASDRHHVLAWREFERDVLPDMEVMRIKAREAVEAHGRASRALQAAEAERDNLELKAKQAAQRFDDRSAALGREVNSLEGLLQSYLKNYVAGSALPALDTDWVVKELEREVTHHKRLLDDDVDALIKQARSLRDVMTEHDSPVAHWVMQSEQELPDPEKRLDHENRILRAQVLCDWFRPGEEARNSYINQINQEMDGFLAVAASFVRSLDVFDARVKAFNRDLQAALQSISGFRRFKDLSVEVKTSMGQVESIGTLRQMQQMLDSKTSSFGSFSVRQRDLPGAEEVALIRRFSAILPSEGVLRVDPNEQVRLECGLTEAGRRRIITNDEEFKAVSSAGNTAMIIALFLIGFLEMVRKKDSSTRMTWSTDEIGRIDPGNLRDFLHVLDAHQIDVIGAAPTANPVQSRFFDRCSVFEDSGAIRTTWNVPRTSVSQGAANVSI